MPTPLQSILESYRATSQTEWEKGSYFEELIRTYLRFEASYADLYSEVWLFADWVKEIGGPQFGFNAKDTGTDIIANTHGTGKTFTDLKIAEETAGKNKFLPFLVPSLHLFRQLLAEWTQQSGTFLHSFVVCSKPDEMLNWRPFHKNGGNHELFAFAS